VPADCPVGTTVKVEEWGPGGGASGGNTSNRAGGAGGAYATSPAYVITPNDVANGVSYLLRAGGAGSAGANSSAGLDTSWSTNNLNLVPDTTNVGAVVGTLGATGVLPVVSTIANSSWTLFGNGTLNLDIVGFGTTTSGAYIDLRLYGTSSTTQASVITGTFPIVASTGYNYSAYLQFIAGTWPADGGTVGLNASTDLGFIGGASADFPVSLTRYNFNATTQVASTTTHLDIVIGFTSGVAVDVTFRISGVQTELGAAPTFWKSTPGYTLAKGGGPTSGTTGGVGGAAASCIPTTGAFSGGNGATRTQGGGGGGSAGKDGAGASSTTGTGGTGDGGSGGAANTDNVEGGGGGTASASGHIGGLPGGGGGANTSTGSGGAGGRGQIRLTYTPVPVLSWLQATPTTVQGPLLKSPTAALTSGATAWAFAVTPPLFDYDWYGPLRDPYLIARLPTAAYPAETHPILPPSLGIIGWYVPLSTPPAHLAPNALPLALRSPSFFPGFLPIVPAAPAFGYYTPFGNPPPPLPSRAVYMPPATGPPPNYAFDRWFQEALSEPPAYLRRPHLSTAIQQAFTPIFTPALPAAPLISNIHPGLPGWSPGSYVLGQRFSNGGEAYQCIQAGNSTVPPTGTGSFIQSVPASGFSSGFSSGWGNPADTAAFKWLSHIDYTNLQAWANDLMAAYSASGLPAPVTALVWNDSTLTSPINTQHLFYVGIPNNGVPTLITCAPGESFRDSSGNPLAFNAAKGVAFVAPATGAEINASEYFAIDVANVTIDGLQFRDLNQTGNGANSGNDAAILIGAGSNASNLTIQNCVIDGFHLAYFVGTNQWLKNCLLINEQTQQNATGSPLWPVKWDFGSTGGAVNCTGIGFNPTGICSIFTTLGGIGQAQMINTTVFGVGNAFFAQNTGGSISADHCALDQSSLSGTSGLTTTDLGGNLLNLVATNQFISAANDFRLKAISGLIDRGRADAADLPSAQDIYRTPRPQGLGWDIGAFEFVFSLTWLGSQPQPSLRPAGLPVALRTQEPPFISIQRAEVTRLDRWYQPLSRLILPRQGLAAHLQQALTLPSSQFAEITTVARWLASYPAIVRGRVVHPSLVPSHVEPVSPTFVQDVSRLQWNASWPRSVVRPFLHPSQVPFRTFQPTLPVFRETTSVDRWYQSLSVPQLWRVYYREQAPPTEPFIPIKIVPVAVTVSPLAGGVIVTGFGPLIKRLRGN
jgi:hypothetical protein